MKFLSFLVLQVIVTGMILSQKAIDNKTDKCDILVEEYNKVHPDKPINHYNRVNEFTLKESISFEIPSRLGSKHV